MRAVRVVLQLAQPIRFAPLLILAISLIFISISIVDDSPVGLVPAPDAVALF